MYHVPARGDLQYFDNVARSQELVRLRKRVEELENGEALAKSNANADKWRRKYERECAARKKDAEKARRETKRSVKLWQQTADDTYSDYLKEKARADKLAEELREARTEIGELRKELDNAAAANKTLVHRLEGNHTNSNMPSSHDRPEATPAKKRHDNNSREVTGRPRGAQPGHPHHPRKKLTPTKPAVYHDERPEDTIGEDGWYRTKKYIERFEVNARVVVEVTPHRAYVWRNRIDGRRRTSAFPEGIHDEVNYSKQTEALVLMLTHVADTAGRKVKQILYEVTGGRLDVSHGWIAGIPSKFSKRCKSEINQIFHDLFESPFLHVDSTVTKNDGKRESVNTACSPVSKAILLTHTKKKGKAAADSLPCAEGMQYEGGVVSDQEAAFMALGKDHQQCLAHHCRKLKSIADMEDCGWAKDMRNLMNEMMKASHEWLDEGSSIAGPSPEQVADWEARYDSILQDGRDYYCKNPPSMHYLDGHNTRANLAENKDSILLFIRKPGIPPTNNMAERSLRPHKRALHQCTTFRSSESIDNWCGIASIVQTSRLRDTEIYPVLTGILSRPVPPEQPETSSSD